MMQFNLDTAIRLPVPDVEALILGRMITAMPKIFIEQGRVFALCPTDVSTNLLPPEQYYRSNFLPIAQSAITQLNSQKATIKAWAKCELCQMLDKSNPLEIFSQLTIWKKEALQQILLQRPYIFLIHLRVYLLPEPLEISGNTQGQFTGLPRSLSVTDASPVLSETAFSQRCHQLENQIPPLHPELEELQSAIAQIATTNPAAKQLDRDIKIFLGWSSQKLENQPDPDLAWINNIAALGNRSKEEDDGKKINWQAGTDFENIVRDSLEFLGFTIDYAHKGGAGGLDLFCSKPYMLVGECKAGKKIPNDTAVQLLNLGTLRLPDKETFNKSAKLIIGPGKPTDQLQESAIKQNMAIINPETLEKLVKLQARYRNSVDLCKLKEYLKPGKSDDEFEKYIQQVEQAIRLRSHIVQAVKQLAEERNRTLVTASQVCIQYTKSTLTDEQVHELLIELSSPLTGYLGRKKGSDWQSDRFYYLRDLVVEKS